MIVQQELFKTIKEAANLLRVSDETIRRMIKAGELDAIRVRGQWRIREQSLDKYLNRPAGQ